MSGPLAGARFVEFAGMGPGPFAAMLLSDMGADIIRIDRTGQDAPGRARNPMLRGRRSIIIDLKSRDGATLVLRMLEGCDGLIEGFRPGAMERLGLGPDVCLARNPRLVYGRVTGWGQSGPMAQIAGHDLNYLALSGVLHAIGRSGAAPTPPLNLLGDYAAGGLYLTMGMLAALLHARETGQGQVVDAAIVDGAASMSTTLHWMLQTGQWTDARGVNAFDSGDPFYDVYETKDGRFISIAAIEPKFYAELRDRLGLAGPDWDTRTRDDWPRQRASLRALFLTQTCDEWSERLSGSDACFAPVLTPDEARADAHNAKRETFMSSGGVACPSPAPRLSGTPLKAGAPPAAPGAHSRHVLAGFGLDADEIQSLMETGVVSGE